MVRRKVCTTEMLLVEVEQTIRATQRVKVLRRKVVCSKVVKCHRV